MAQINERALQMLSTALDMEAKGRDFYLKAAVTSSNKMGRDIWTMLADDELIHIERLERIFKSLKGGQTWPGDWKTLKIAHADLGEMFRKMAVEQGARIKAETGDLEALEAGISFEDEAVKFYQAQLTKATDPVEREFVEKMVLEERAHHVLLADMKIYLVDPAAWFRERERGGLDGA